MIGANLLDHPAILLLIAFIALVRWLVSKAKTQTPNTQTPMTPPAAQPITRGGETQTEEERIRKFLEALGKPAGSAPPPKVRPRPRPVTPQLFPKLPPFKTAPPPLPAEPFPGVAPPPLPLEVATARGLAPLDPDFQVQDFARQTSSEPPPDPRRQPPMRFDARVRLATPQDLRTAIVLREIFGPPRSLQSFDLTSGS